MGSRGFETDILENWPLGVITSIVADRLPDGAVPDCKNGQFYNMGPNNIIFGTRKGAELQNDDAADEGIVSQYFLNGLADNFHFLVLDNGDLAVLDAGTISVLASTLFTETAAKFSWQTANSLAFVVNGTDQFKTDGADAYPFGIQAPDDADWSASAASGGSNLPAGAYNLLISYFNSTTGHEGPQSEPKAVTIAGGQQINVVLPDSGDINDSQVDFIKIYIEQEDVRNDFFLVVAGTAPAMTDTSGWAVGTTDVDIDCSSSELEVFEILSPGVNNNYPPPPAARFIQNHLSRLFAATETDIYWSEVDDPESFNLLDRLLPVGENDGENISGLGVVGETLIIFKRGATYALVGSMPDSWQIVLLDKTVGCVSADSIAALDNKLFFMSLRGPQSLAGVSDGIADMTTLLIEDKFDEDNIDPADLDNCVVVPHPTQHYVGWAIQPRTESANTVIIPFDYKLKRWMGEWRMLDVQTCTVITDSNGRQWPCISGSNGYVYKVGVRNEDGLPSGVVAEGTLTGATTSTLTDTTVTWPVDGLIGRYVYVWSDATGVRNARRYKITSNTATELTVSPTLSPLPIAGQNYSIGGILFDWRSAFRNGGQPFAKKRIEFLFVELNATTAGVMADVEVYVDNDQSNPVIGRTLAIGDADVYGVGIFGVAHFAEEGAERFRIPIRTTGYNWQTRVIHMSSGEQLQVYRNGVQWQTKTKHTGNG